MEKTLCDDCAEEAKAKINNLYYCAVCALRVLQQEAQRNGRGLGLQRKPRSSVHEPVL